MLTIDLWSWDPGLPLETPEDACRAMRDRAVESLHTGADIVLFPEFAWMSLAPVLRKGDHPGKDDIARVGRWFWRHCWHGLLDDPALSRGLIVFGTSPCEVLTENGTTEWRNRAPILIDGHPSHQDKLNLTPWESRPISPGALSLAPGRELRLFTFAELTVAVLICLDIEIPEISSSLRGLGVDLILVPSATETRLGAERITRCASARAVELGCHVAVSPLTGKTKTDLIDVNVGWTGFYSPSQAAYGETDRESRDPDLIEEGCVRRRFRIDLKRLSLMRRNRLETNPSLLLRVEFPEIEMPEVVPS